MSQHEPAVPLLVTYYDLVKWLWQLLVTLNAHTLYGITLCAHFAGHVHTHAQSAVRKVYYIVTKRHCLQIQ